MTKKIEETIYGQRTPIWLKILADAFLAAAAIVQLSLIDAPLTIREKYLIGLACAVGTAVFKIATNFVPSKK